jgi:hypothetical protein
VTDGQLSHMAGSLVVNVALELVLEAEKELVLMWPELLHRNPYSSMSKFVSSYNGLMGPSKTYNATLRDNDYMYINTFVSLEKYVSYGAVSVDGQLPWVIPVSNVYSALRVKPPAGQDWIAEDELLSRHLHEIEFKCRYTERHHESLKGHHLPVEDAIMSALEWLPTGHGIGIHCVFGARVMLDIHKIMGYQVASGWGEVTQRSATISAALGVTWTNKVDPTTSAKQLVPTQCCHQRRNEWERRRLWLKWMRSL